MTDRSPEWEDGYTTGFADAAKRDPDYDAQQWALWQIRAEKAEAKLNALARICDERERRARDSLERMHGGQPFAATLSVEDVRAILKEFA